jgi:hypothetical protein
MKYNDEFTVCAASSRGEGTNTALPMIVAFIHSLFDHGNIQVGHPNQPIAEAEWSQADELLVQHELIHRAEFPGEPPPFILAAAIWATRALYRACQAVTYRDLSAEAFPKLLGDACPPGEAASVHYSVDLAFQFLPDLMKLASHISAEDPLLKFLQDWANQFPLSSVGIRNVTPRGMDAMLSHPVLLRYYVDRIIARRDVSRLSNPIVRQEVQRAIGSHQVLFPELVRSTIV